MGYNPPMGASSTPLNEERLAALRRLLGEEGLSGFVVPRADEHQGEYVAPCSERLLWLTGFGGSAGRAIVLAEDAALFVDGRYDIEAREAVPPSVEVLNIRDHTPQSWLSSLGRAGANGANGANGTNGASSANGSAPPRLGYDPWHSSRAQAASLARQAQASGWALAPLERNPLDRLWQERPSPPSSPVRLQPPEFAGESAADKCRRLGAELAAGGRVVVRPHPAGLHRLGLQRPRLGSGLRPPSPSPSPR